ncbi:MAG TPA: hypothetical protein VF988_09670 [Verrucomicrobiae bacterium]
MQSNAPSPVVSPDSLARHRETSDHRPRNVLAIAASAAGLILFSLAVAGVCVGAFARHRAMQSVQPLGLLVAPDLAPLARFPRPNLAVDDDHQQMLTLRAAQTNRLNSYGWVDQTKGVAHIPIERAMALLLERGFPIQTNGGATSEESPLQLIQSISEQR